MPGKIEHCMADVMANKKKLSQICKRVRPTLLVGPASTRLAEVSEDIAAGCTKKVREDSEHPKNNLLRDALAGVNSNSLDYVIIDTPPGEGSGVLLRNVHRAATEIIAPVECKAFAMHGLGHMVVGFKKARTMNPKIRLTGIVISRIKANQKEDKKYRKILRDQFAEKVFETEINESVRISEAQSRKKGILEYEPWSPSGLKYEKLIQEVIDRGEANG